MRLTRISSFPLAALCLCSAAPARAQPPPPPQGQQQAAANAPAAAATNAAVDPAGVWGRFVAKETEFQRAFLRYAYRRDAVFQSVGMGGQVTGEYHRLSRITFDERGAARERVLDMPVPTLAPSPSDLEDLDTLQLYVLEAAKLPLYDFKYVSRERIDEIDTYIYDVTPKVMPDPKKSKARYFQGRVWIDDKDFQLVKARGKGVPSGKEVFP
ncbi:MAG: outer membrane lipoprotein-sorting protein, partial [Acidobacteria bacterium]|nr:outer membrane lipoprotein-sorting protein [Acidobacteriota bacterium]